MSPNIQIRRHGGDALRAALMPQKFQIEQKTALDVYGISIIEFIGG
jgi:hypothetical protein